MTQFLFATMEALIERAIELAGSAEQQRSCETLSVSICYGICCSEYFKAYDDGDTARLKELSEKYDLLISRMKKYKYNISSIATIYQMRGELPGGADTRPIPDKYAGEG